MDAVRHQIQHEVISNEDPIGIDVERSDDILCTTKQVFTTESASYLVESGVSENDNQLMNSSVDDSSSVNSIISEPTVAEDRCGK